MAPDSLRRRIAQTLGFRLAIYYAAIFVASVLAISVSAYLLLERSLVARDHELIFVKLADYTNRYESAGLSGLSEAVGAEQASGTDDRVFVRLVGPNADVRLASMPPSWGAYDLDDLGAGEGWRSVPAHDQPVSLEVATRRLPGGVLLEVGRTTLERERLLAQVRGLLGRLFGLVVALGLVGGFALTWSTLAPLRELAETLRRITRTGRFEGRVPVGTGRDVISELGRTSNSLLARIDQLIRGMRDALDAVAHDLRTPVARLRSRAESALVADVIEEADRVSSLLTTLMDISEAETGVMRLDRTAVDVAAVAAETVELYEDVAEQKGVALASVVPEGLVASADRPRLRQVLANVVDNAVKYTPPGGTVSISGRAMSDQVVIEVSDTGSGIAPEHLPRIWDRLYRADGTGSERGLGLGLSLVKAVVEAHGGRAKVTSSVGKGTTIRAEIPLANDRWGTENSLMNFGQPGLESSFIHEMIV
jgi:signal transduction histidine kinase